MSKGCVDCRHYKITPASCLAGNVEEMNSWWRENGGKTRSQGFTEASCFKSTENAERLDALIALANQALEIRR